MRLLLLYFSFTIVLTAKLSGQEHDAFSAIKMQPFSEKGIYRFPSFTNGVVLTRTGVSSSQKLNFNISLNEMHFISDKGDTLSIAEPEALRSISIQGSKFYYDKGFYQVVDSIGELMLAFTQLLSIQQHRVSAYGMTEPHEGVRTYSFYSMNGKTDAIGKDEKITVTAREIYFFGDKYGKFTKAGKAFILTHFKRHEEEISTFIKTHRTNFQVLGDLQQLMRYCEKLSP